VYVNQTNLNGKLRKKLGGHGLPIPLLESPLLARGPHAAREPFLYAVYYTKS